MRSKYTRFYLFVVVFYLALSGSFAYGGASPFGTLVGAAIFFGMAMHTWED